MFWDLFSTSNLFTLTLKDRRKRKNPENVAFCRRSGVCQTRMQMSRVCSICDLDLPQSPRISFNIQVNEYMNEKDILWLVLPAINVEKIGWRRKIRHFCRRSGVCQTRIQVSRLSSSLSLDLPKTPLGVWKNLKKNFIQIITKVYLLL